MMSGLAYMTGPKGRPLRVGASANDIMGGLFGAFAIIGALYMAINLPISLLARRLERRFTFNN